MEDPNTKYKKILDHAFDSISKDLPNTKIYKNLISHSLSNVMEFDLAFNKALTDFNASKSAEIFEIESLEWVNILRVKLTKLMFLNDMLLGSGLLDFREEIMSKMITNLFPQKTGNLSIAKKIVQKE